MMEKGLILFGQKLEIRVIVGIAGMNGTKATNGWTCNGSASYKGYETLTFFPWEFFCCSNLIFQVDVLFNDRKT